MSASVDSRATKPASFGLPIGRIYGNVDNVDSRPIRRENVYIAYIAYVAQLTSPRLRAAAHTEACAGRESLTERSDFRQRLNGRIHTQSYVKISVLASILLNTVGYVLS